MKTMLLKLVLILYVCTRLEGAKVLVVFSFPSPSHNILGVALAKGLAKDGFDVTYVSPFDVKDAPKNLKSLKLDGLWESFFQGINKGEVDLFALESQYRIANLLIVKNMGQKLTEITLNHEVVKKLLKSKEQYDVVIIQQFWNDALHALSSHFKAHLILFSLLGSNKWVNNFIGNPEPPSYISDFLVSFSGSNPTFWDRTKNLVLGMVSQATLDLMFYPAQNRLLKQFFPDGPDLYQLQQNVTLVLSNSHESISEPVPYVPNMISIGGFHVAPVKQLPSDLQDFMDSTKEGVIYFSMGSNLQPSKMPQSIKEAILKVLGSRKEKVLWKWDEENLQNKPANVKISKWFPQQDILAHPNCKLFITHGGLLSTTETVYHGVPVLAFPIFGDQKTNAARAEMLGYGKFLSFFTINENNLKEILEELLENPKYRENAQTRSKMMHDRPIAPMKLAIYWVNYVINHKGARHLRVAGANMSYYKYYMLDVFAAIFAATFVTFYLFYTVTHWLINKRSKRKVKHN